MHRKSAMAMAAAVLVAACGRSGAERSSADSVADTSRIVAAGPDPSHALFACLVGDSAVYSDVKTDSVTGSTSGIRIALWQAGDGIDGSTAPARDLEHSVPIARVRLVGRDSILLDMPAEMSSPDTIGFVGRVACDSLWGRQQTSRTVPQQDASYRRSR